MFKKLILVFLTSITTVAIASSGGEGGHGHGGIPWSTIVFQLVNLIVIIGGLYYYLKKPISDYFENRKNSYILAASRAQQIKEEAEKRHEEIRSRLTKLESTASDSVEKAKADAEAYRVKLLNDGKEIASKIKEEAQKTVEIEVQQGIIHLKEEIISLAIQGAREVLQKEIKSNDQERLQDEFSKKIQAANNENK